ncbi:MAG TPA: bifunctional hydroxymethylpyrimidine kinase/phosphomethylpyrimidine kinase [Anaerolineae bacterium]
MKTALTIAGSDSGGGAGIQADLKTFAARGVYGMSVITALTAQNTIGVQGVFEIPPDFVALQIDSVAQDIVVHAVKTGMIANSAIIEVVAQKVQQYKLAPLVVDPVMVAKSGDALLRADARDTLISVLLPLATVVTPNVPEAEVLCGFTIANLDDMKRAARTIREMGPRNVVVKGGHLLRDVDSVDVLFDGVSFEMFSGQLVHTTSTHGTGCTFASAIAAELAKGATILEAVRAAKEYVTALLVASQKIHLGHGHGPMNHMALLIPPESGN